jgi:hypothetical protein
VCWPRHERWRQCSDARSRPGAISGTACEPNAAGEGIAVISSLDASELRIAVEPGRRKVSISINDPPLAPGEYAVDVGIAPTPQGASCGLIYDFPPLCSRHT